MFSDADKDESEDNIVVDEEDEDVKSAKGKKMSNQFVCIIWTRCRI